MGPGALLALDIRNDSEARHRAEQYKQVLESGSEGNELFKDLIDKEYPADLYVKQLALYLDNVLGRIDLQDDAYSKEKNIPDKLFDVLEAQKEGLLDLRETYGAIVSPAQLEDSPQ